jgi:hypothetical protein
MERIVLAVILLASIIAVNTQSAPAAGVAAQCPAVEDHVVHVAPMPPIPPVPPMPPVMMYGHGHGPDFDFDFDFDFDIDQAISRELAAGEKATCPSGSACEYSCDDGKCDVTCESGSACSFDCDGGACHQACASGAACEFECDGPACKSTCAPGSVCSITDASGRTTTRIHR